MLVPGQMYRWNPLFDHLHFSVNISNTLNTTLIGIPSAESFQFGSFRFAAMIVQAMFSMHPRITVTQSRIAPPMSTLAAASPLVSLRRSCRSDCNCANVRALGRSSPVMVAMLFILLVERHESGASDPPLWPFSVCLPSRVTCSLDSMVGFLLSHFSP